MLLLFPEAASPPLISSCQRCEKDDLKDNGDKKEGERENDENTYDYS
jgi:hypothetical protein